ncbi:MAG: zinc ribbon domain-containing protein [Candidatus Heimdallarchaeota archaeon]|nr:zinc ribbon domain-containing protein [Candidatus Heimdallarchaeota archaeon]
MRMAWMLVLLLMIQVASAELGDDSDPEEIIPGFHLGSLEEYGTYWYKINLTGNYEIILEANETTDFDLYIYDSFNTSIDKSIHNYYPDSVTAYNYDGLYLIAIYAYSGSGAYSLNITSFPQIPGDHESNPMDIAEGEYSHYLDIRESMWYNCSMLGNVEIELQGPSGSDFDLYLYSQSLELISYDSGSYYPKSITIYTVNATYLIKVYARSGAGEFLLTIHNFPQIQGDSPDNPIPLEIEDSKAGYLPGSSEDNSIWYSISISGYQRFILLSPLDVDFEMILYDDALSQVDSATGSYRNEMMTTEELDGDYLLEVYSYSGLGNYTLITQVVGIGPGSSYNDAVLLENNYTGIIPGPALDRSFWFRIEVTGDYSISLTAEFYNDFDLRVYTSNLYLLDSSTGTDYPEQVDLIDVQGTYFVNIIPYSDDYGWFILEIHEIKDDPVLSSFEDYTQEEDESTNYFPFITFFVVMIVIMGYSIRKVLLSRPAKPNKVMDRFPVSGPRICRACSNINEPEAIFCENCGTNLL